MGDGFSYLLLKTQESKRKEVVKMAFKNYNGPDKYHFRIYKKGKGHPFIVAVVEEKEIDGKIFLSGYMITHSIIRVINRPNDYVKMECNPNPHDDADSYLCINRVSEVESNAFSKPYNNWHLSSEDEKTIDELEEQNSSY